MKDYDFLHHLTAHLFQWCSDAIGIIYLTF